MARYHITVIRPQGYLHSDCFFEVAEGIGGGLTSLGHTVSYAENTIATNAPTIIFGAHLYAEYAASILPPSAIVYNLEQLGVSYTPDWYMRLAAHTQIWDYTPHHLDIWRQFPCLNPPRLVEIGYDPCLRRIVSTAAPDIDVLFYGSLTDRRKLVLDQLSAAGLRVEASFGVYGAERDALIARSKVILNLHAHQTQVFEVVRVSYLLANAKAVVAEESMDLGHLADAVAVCTHDNAAAICMRLLANDSERLALEQRGYSVFSSRTQHQILAPIVGPANPYQSVFTSPAT